MPHTDEAQNTVVRLILWPFRPLLDARALRRLRRQMPNAHRLWVHVHGGIRPENNTEFLARLRQLGRERSLAGKQYQRVQLQRPPGVRT